MENSNITMEDELLLTGFGFIFDSAMKPNTNFDKSSEKEELC